MSKRNFPPRLIPVLGGYHDNGELLPPQYWYEHTPLDYYRYGEYPRFIRPVDAHKPRTKIQETDQ